MIPYGWYTGITCSKMMLMKFLNKNYFTFSKKKTANKHERTLLTTGRQVQEY